MKKSEVRNCGNCNNRKVYHLNFPCNSCVKEKKIAIDNHWKAEVEDEN